MCLYTHNHHHSINILKIKFKAHMSIITCVGLFVSYIILSLVFHPQIYYSILPAYV